MFVNTNRYENSEDSIPIRMKNENDHIKLFDTSNLSLGLSDSDLESLIIRFKDHILFSELNTQLLIICTSLQYLNLERKISDEVVKTIYNIYNAKNKHKNHTKLKEDIYIYIKFIKMNTIPNQSKPSNDDDDGGYDNGGYGEEDDYGGYDNGGYGEDDYGGYDGYGDGEEYDY